MKMITDLSFRCSGLSCVGVKVICLFVMSFPLWAYGQASLYQSESMSDIRQTNGGLMIPEILTPSPEQPPDVQLLRTVEPSLDQAHKRDIDAIYRIGQRSTPLFDSALWIFDASGRFAFMTEAPEPWLIGDIEIMGQYERRANSIELHGSFWSPRGVTLTLDGTVHPTPNGFQLHALYGVSIRGFQQVERITQLLIPDPARAIPESVGQLLRTDGEGVAHPLETSPTSRVPRFQSEPTAVIHGIPVPSIYRITLSGRTEAGEFRPFRGKLLVNGPTPDGENPLSLLLMAEEEVRNGWIMWNSELDAPTTSKPARTTRILLEGGHIEATISPDGPVVGGITWYTLAEGSPGARKTVPVHAERGTLTLESRGDDIVGIINATGTGLGDTPILSHYEGTLEGTLEGARLVRPIVEDTGPHPFSGRWRDAALGIIELRQTDETVEGAWAGGIFRLKGMPQAHLLHFAWHAGSDTQGQGFLRLVPGGDTLIGWLQRDPEITSPQIIIAAQSDIRDPLAKPQLEITPGDIREFKYLGQDLASQGKCQQAVGILEKVVQYYTAQAEASTKEPMAREGFLVDQAMPRNSLIRCYFELGNYKSLFQHLKSLLTLNTMLDAESLWSMRFQHNVDTLREIFSRNIELLTTVEGGTKRFLKTIQSGGTGITVGPVQDRGGVIVSALSEGMPATAAGVEIGDVLVRVDGQPLTGLTVEEVIGLLQGPPGTQVEITVRRAGRNFTYTLSRTPLLPLATPNREAILSGVATLAERATDWRSALDTALEDIEALDRRLRTREVKVEVAFQGLQEQSARAHREMATAITDTIPLGHAMLRATPALHGYYTTMLKHLEASASGQSMDMPHILEVQNFEAQVKEFLANDRETSWVAKTVYTQQVALLRMLSIASFELKTHANAIQRSEVGRNYEAATVTTRAALHDLPMWIEQWRARLVTDAAKIQALEEGQDFFRLYVGLLADYREPDAALVASEAARTRAFLDLLATRASVDPSPAGSTLADTDLKSLVTAPSLGLADLQEAVRANGTVVLEYFLLDDRILIWVISPMGRVQMQEVPAERTTLEHAIERFVTLVDPTPKKTSPESDQVSRAEQAQADVESSELLEQFHRLLIAPIENLLPKSAQEVVTVIPHGHLFRLPFAALKGRRDGKDRFLIEDHTLVYAPSIGVLKHVQQLRQEGHRRRPPTLLALVNPSMSANMVDSDNQPFAPLDTTEQHFDKILRYYPNIGSNRILVGPAATKATFLAETHNYEVIYFATHAEAIEADPTMSYIVLADARLRVPEVARAKLQTELVILGACQTARGRISGDGVEGLGRLFISAGAPALLTTLWKVPDRQTFEQSFQFHAHWLRQGQSKAAALREAQLQGRWTFPEQVQTWAGFILVGAWQ